MTRSPPKTAGTILAACLAVSFISLQIIAWAGTSMGVVREHCLDIEASQALGRPQVESGWEYILFPPITFANLDPNGICVRNSPLREGLAALGIWGLPSPEEQVREHIAKQQEPGGAH